MKAKSDRVHGLDTLRSLAIVSVIVFHIWGFGGEGTLPEWLVPIAKQGWMGVDLFFVLSGYLIGSQLLRPYLRSERPLLWEFYRKRCYRILPAYLGVLALYFFIPGWREIPDLAPPWPFLTFTLNLVIGSVNAFAFSHAWSLCVEEHFYLALPVLVILLMRKPSARRAIVVVTLLLLVGMGVRGFILFHWLRPLATTSSGFAMFYLTHIYYPTYSHFDGLLAGVCLASIKLFRPTWWGWLSRHGHASTSAAVVLVGISVYLFRDRYESASGAAAVGVVVGFPVLSLGLGLLVASSLSANSLLRRFRVPGAKSVAILAYSLYLTHKELIHLVNRVFPAVAHWNAPGWLAVYASCCLAVSSTLYFCVERPFLRLRDRRPAASKQQVIYTASQT